MIAQKQFWPLCLEKSKLLPLIKRRVFGSDAKKKTTHNRMVTTDEARTEPLNCCIFYDLNSILLLTFTVSKMSWHKMC